MTRARGGKRTVALTEADASKVVSDAAWVNGCPFCSALARPRIRCEVFAEEFGYWKRTVDQVASVIRVAPRRRRAK